MATRLDSYVDRIDPVRLSVKNPYGIPITLFANEDVPIEVEAIEEILQVASVQQTVESISKASPDFWGHQSPGIRKIVLSPDFHKGSGIPIGTILQTEGFIVPQAPGNDIGCGMRLLTTDVTREDILPHVSKLMPILRGIFFEGKREVIMSPRQKEAMLRSGLWGLLETVSDNKSNGIWRYYDEKTQSDDLMKVHFQGVLPAADIFRFGDYVKGSGAIDSRDAQAGSLGGSNHFCEIQVVEDTLDGSLATQWGLKKNHVTIMAHSGSVGLGHGVGGYFKDQAIDIFPQIKRPEHGLFMMPTSGKHAELAQKYLDAMRNAANFAFGNRLFLGLMAVRAISEVLGRDVHANLVYDAPHNLIWEDEGGAGMHLHRKGATPANGPSGIFARGIPLLIPGSMGSSSYVMVGLGNEESLCSACHGAGRAISRGKSRRHSDLSEIAKLHVVTPIDPESPMVKRRPDIVKELQTRLMEEKTSSYKAINPVANTVHDARIARPVVRLSPILTIKG